MNDLIKIESREGRETVNARTLHKFLENGKQFTDWIKHRIDAYDFGKGNDYIVIHDSVKNVSGGRPSTEYHISLDMAKELSMVERNDKGKQARSYFIEMEKQAKKEFSSLSPLDMFESQVKAMRVQQDKLDSLEEKINLVEAKQLTTQNDYFTVIGYCSLKGIKVTATMANALGRKCAKFSREYDYKVDKVTDPRYGQINSYHIDVLSENIP